MPHNSLTLLSRDDLDCWHVREELERSRAAFQANPNPDNKARYLRAYRAVLAWAMAEAEITQPEGLIDKTVAAVDARLNSEN
jgi:hypothetical protein